MALLSDSPPIHPAGNLLSRTTVKRGDLEGAEARTAHLAHGIYQTQMIEHGYMEPECAIGVPAAHPAAADISDGLSEGVVLHILSQSQGVYEDQVQIAKQLGLPLEAVRVTLVPNGGGFGGKEDLSVQGHAALMAHLIGAPVKVGLTRDESITMHPKRHPCLLYTSRCV